MSTETEVQRAIALLVACARRRTTLTYPEFADIMGNMIPQGASRVLNPVGDFCRRTGLPELWVLVVGTNSGLPSREAWNDTWTAERVMEEMIRCYGYNWRKLS